MTIHQSIPQTGFKGLKENWKNDLIAGLSVALVALPSCMGIAIASGAPAMSGVIPVVLGGFIVTFLKSGSLGVTGPAAGLITITISANELYSDGVVSGYPYVLAAFIIAGLFQLLMGIFRLGNLGNFFPSSVIHGMLAAIGIIIISKQIPASLGILSEPGSMFNVIKNIPTWVLNLNPFVAIIAINTIMILVIHPKIKNKFIHFIPGTIWAIIFAIPFVFAFDFESYRNIDFLNRMHNIGPFLLVRIPENLFNSIVFPNFSKIAEPQFWLIVFSITLVSSIESLISAKAVDKLDPFSRKTNLSKELSALGIGTILSGFIGGLPIATVIAKSSVNISHGGRTKWANFFQGLVILTFIVLLSPIVKTIPLAALAGILVFIGYKLTSPKLFKDSYLKGKEQLFILIATIIATLVWGLIMGIVIGTFITLIIHFATTKLPLPKFITYLIRASMNIVHLKNDSSYYIKVRGIANFINIQRLSKQLEKIPPRENVIVDFSHTEMIDHTMMEFVHDYQLLYINNGGNFDITGLSVHISSSEHPDSIHRLGKLKSFKPKRLSKRQEELKRMANYQGWEFRPKRVWSTKQLRPFSFFETRPVEFKKNTIKGSYKEYDTTWEISDITFDEGALLATEVYHTTVEIITLPIKLPSFTLEKEVFFNKLIQFAGYEDIDFKTFTEFSNQFTLKGKDKESIRKLFTPELIKFFEYEDIYHLESYHNKLLVFRQLRIASPREILKMNKFSKELVCKLVS